MLHCPVAALQQVVVPQQAWGLEQRQGRDVGRRRARSCLPAPHASVLEIIWVRGWAVPMFLVVILLLKQL